MNTSVELGLFSSRLAAICDEAGALLQRAAFSPNIKDRLDFSCAVFDAHGKLCAQAAHIPVHLGSMAYAMKDVVSALAWHEGDVVVFNDPYLGGTHLPDVTLVEPVFVDGGLQGFVANRAHHANIGADQPGSMPIASTLDEEGLVISPQHIVSQGTLNESLLQQMSGSRQDPRLRGDFLAQISACHIACERLKTLIQGMGVSRYLSMLRALNAYAYDLAIEGWKTIPDGEYYANDVMDDDGLGVLDIPIALALTVASGRIRADFSGTAAQVSGNINCPLSVTAAAVFYALRCLLPSYAPACAGTFAPIELIADNGSLVYSHYPAAVAAGNVETSSRIVDVVLAALAQAMPERIPAASQGTMNNIAMGWNGSGGFPAWDYYETLGGGAGASASGPGLSGRQTHMTNTLNTPVESLEKHYPVLIREYGLRRGSGGAGEHHGGDGVIRSYEFLAPACVSLLTERRRHAPWAVNGAAAGATGENRLNEQVLKGKQELRVQAGDVLTIKTPGGGGWNPSGETR